ncbi:MAG: fibrobacter succinogenes major paralogous domain-containing protein [Fibrobacter sp.]|nr:fibrobacter succinogenes major paralogous domain-containing protein [Fibrobacter sp.]
MKIFLYIVCLFLLVACTELGERDNPLDPNGTEYMYKQIPISSSATNENLSEEKGTFIDFRDGKTYRMVKIGTQTWMAENLNYINETSTPNLIDANWCYNDDSKNCDTYGRLYTWASAMNLEKKYNNKIYGIIPSIRYQGICPEGWHIPNDEEWNFLENFVDGLDNVDNNAGYWLKSKLNWNGIDGVGFTALPSGYKNYYDNFSLLGSFTNFWSASEYGSYDASYRDMDSGYSNLGSNDLSYKSLGRSVRCLKD